MYVVAITELVTPIEAEAAALAADLGTTAYEERLKLVVGVPAIVMTSADPGRATELGAKIAKRGHQVFVFDRATVVPSSRMVAVRRFSFEASALAAPEASAELPFSDVLGIFRAMQSARVESRTETTTKKLDLGRAVLTGGLVLRKEVKTSQVNVATSSEQVLYVFPAHGQRPWLLRERAVSYDGLGAGLDPTSARNFLTFIARLRERAPGAVYDERLLNGGLVARLTRMAGGGTDSVSVSSADGVDLVAHILALQADARASRGL